MKIVIVGGGFGGLKLALELRNKTGFEVTLISERSNFEYHGALYRSGTGRSPLEVVIPLRDVIGGAKNIDTVLDRIVGLDVSKRRVVSETGNSYYYDKLVLAMGNVINYYGILGMADESMSLDTIANTIALRRRLVELCRSKKSKLKIAIVGAGAAGVELAGELNYFASLISDKYDIPQKDLKVTLIEGAARVLPGLRQAASKKALRRLEKLGIDVRLNTQLNSCQPGKVCLDSGDLEADLIVWAAGGRAPGFFIEHPEIFTMAHGRVKVDQYLNAVGHDDIYVIGDNAATPFSGMAQTALHDAKFLAKNFLAEADSKSMVWYRTKPPIYAIPIGQGWAILQTQRKVLSGKRAWAVRRRADLAIFRNFEPYKRAIKTWRKANKLAEF